MSKSTSLLEDGRANPIASQGSEKPLRTNGIFGPSYGECFARLGPDGSWAKTYQGYYQANLDGSLEPYSGTWPKWGLMYGGACMEHVTWVRRIDGSGYSYLPTPQVLDSQTGDDPSRAQRKREEGWSQNLNDAILWGTPKSSEYKGSSAYGTKAWARDVERQNLKAQVMEPSHPGQLNPDWVECLMGLPVGWTDIDVENDQLQSVPWPAGFGQEQFEWEPPRVTKKSKNRRQRLQALGNGVVPEQIAPVFAELVRLERGDGACGP